MDNNKIQDTNNSQNMDSNEVVVSSIRPGMKREFTMMMKTQSEIGEIFLGHKRVTRSQHICSSSKGTTKSGCGMGKTHEVGIVDALNSKEKESDCLEAAGKVEGPSKINLERAPTKLKDLLATRLLEGLNVRYVHGPKSCNDSAKPERQGVIQGNGIMCCCGECGRKNVFSPTQFELHAHSRNKRPPEYIYMENGKSLRDVLNACKANRSDPLDTVIRNAIGRLDSTTSVYCLKCKELIPKAKGDTSTVLCDSCEIPKVSDPGSIQISDNAPRYLLPDSLAPIASTSQLKAPKSFRVSTNGQPRAEPPGTKKNMGMHKSLFKRNALKTGDKLYYIVNKKVREKGYVKYGAIYCFCCEAKMSPSQFEKHAGFGHRRNPYHNIYTSEGKSLHRFLLELSKKGEMSSTANDDFCSICEHGGELMCCGNCTQAFHVECVGLSVVPRDTWYCTYCENMSREGKSKNHDACGLALKSLVDVGTSDFDEGGWCVVCMGHDFTKTAFNERTIMICDQCEKEYHVGCLREQKMHDLKVLPKGDWFCSNECSNINSVLQTLIKKGEQPLLEGSEKNLNITWRLLRGRRSESSNASRKWLSGAVSIFHDRFYPIADSGNSRLDDLIPHMVYGRTFKCQDFSGMYCAILLVNSVVVSAGVFRILGEEVAELPLVATKRKHQGKGYFKALFSCIQNIVASVNVKHLVLPAAHEAESMWINKFGFEKLEQEQMDEYSKNYQQLMMFEGTSFLHKSIP